MSTPNLSAKMRERNAAICAYYNAGHGVNKCCERFSLGRQRVQQILRAAGLWQPHEKTDRTRFLGISVSDETKAGLKQRADDEGVSVSRLASDALDALVAKD